MAKKKLKLEILDPKGKTIRTHHFFYEVSGGKGSRLRLTLNDNTYIMDGDGKLVILTQNEIEVEEKLKLTIDKEWADNLKTRLDAQGSIFQTTMDTEILLHLLVKNLNLGFE